MMPTNWLFFLGLVFWIVGVGAAIWVGMVKQSIVRKYDKDGKFSQTDIFGTVSVNWKSKDIPKELIAEWRLKRIPELNRICITVTVTTLFIGFLFVYLNNH
jgi:hypothetical protein